MGMPQTIQMANLGMADSLILMVMALVVFGPRRLPQIGRQIGKLMYEFRKASNDFKFQMEEELRNAEDADRRKADEERMRALAVTNTTPKLSAPEAMASLLPASSVEPAPDPDAVESPYPVGDVFSSATAENAGAVAEETIPRIQPPAEGEQVAAARPNGHTSLASDQAQAVAEQTDFVFEPAPADETQPAPEAQPTPDPAQAAHHG
jgi:sec-independent protein translocase protein TatB